MMRLYHVTSRDNAYRITENGFEDRRECAQTHDLADGAILFADRPIYDDEAVFPDLDPTAFVYFVIDVPEKHLSDYELDNKGVDYREFEIPIDEVNGFFVDRDPHEIPSDLSQPAD